MSKLDDFISTKNLQGFTELETDISSNPWVRKLFFNQISDLDFNLLDSPTEKSVYIDTRLNAQEGFPFRFLFELDSLILIPQYTKTHRCYMPKVESEEYFILKKLVEYVKDYFSHKKRNVQKIKDIDIANFLSFVCGDSTNKGVHFEVSLYNDDYKDILDRSIEIKSIDLYGKNRNVNFNIIHIEVYYLNDENVTFRTLKNPEFENNFDISILIKDNKTLVLDIEKIKDLNIKFTQSKLEPKDLTLSCKG